MKYEQTFKEMKKDDFNKTYSVLVGNGDHKIKIGDGSPIVIQSMTNTDTADVTATTNQILKLVEAGSELVRITINDSKAAESVPAIYNSLKSKGIEVPIVGDFHYNGHILLNDYPDCAEVLSKYRINPGNVGQGKNHDLHFSKIIEIACKNNKVVRIGGNWGSLDREMLIQVERENSNLSVPLRERDIMYQAMIRSVLSSAHFAEKIGLSKNKIVLSCKTSVVKDLVLIYSELASKCKYPLHLGLTEAGMGSSGIVASTVALFPLLQRGIGDTIRISLTPRSVEDRIEEVLVAQEILQAMGIRNFVPIISSCPGCGRTSFRDFQKLVDKTKLFLRENIKTWKYTYHGVENMKVAVMGCTVNGLGESKNADIGISLPGSNKLSDALVFINGKQVAILSGSNIDEQFHNMIKDYVKISYGIKK